MYTPANALQVCCLHSHQLTSSRVILHPPHPDFQHKSSPGPGQPGCPLASLASVSWRPLPAMFCPGTGCSGIQNASDAQSSELANCQLTEIASSLPAAVAVNNTMHQVEYWSFAAWSCRQNTVGPFPDAVNVHAMEKYGDVGRVMLAWKHNI